MGEGGFAAQGLYDTLSIPMRNRVVTGSRQAGKTTLRKEVLRVMYKHDIHVHIVGPGGRDVCVNGHCWSMQPVSLVPANLPRCPNGHGPVAHPSGLCSDCGEVGIRA